MRNEGNRIRWSLSRAALPAACLGLALGYVELRRESPAPASPSSNRVVRAAAPENERVAALEREVRLLRAAASSRSEQAEQGGAAVGESPERSVQEYAEEEAEEALTPAQRRQAREARIAADRAARGEFLQELDARIESEPVAPKWRATTQGLIADSFAKQLGSDVSVAASTCASTTCRVELEHPSQPRLPFAKLAELSMQRTEALGAMEMHYDVKSRDGATTVYLVRQPDDTRAPDDG